MKDQGQGWNDTSIYRCIGRSLDSRWHLPIYRRCIDIEKDGSRRGHRNYVLYLNFDRDLNRDVCILLLAVTKVKAFKKNY